MREEDFLAGPQFTFKFVPDVPKFTAQRRRFTAIVRGWAPTRLEPRYGLEVKEQNPVGVPAL
ncbi:MAG TPA: hypothetical protein VK615_14860, partial [Candidatus Binatia bacterium]|nr:hypothetical protein [Candidatus Binatia bacterium]